MAQRDAAGSYEPVRATFALLSAWYVSTYLRRPGEYLFLDHVDLTIHEAGHVLFAWLGESVSIAGGTLLQLIVPVVFVLYFVRQRQAYSAAVVLFWVAQSLFNVAVYAADARAMELPLVGGADVIHDWNYLLGSVGWLRHDATVAGIIQGAAMLTWLAALGGSLASARRTVEIADTTAPLTAQGWTV